MNSIKKYIYGLTTLLLTGFLLVSCQKTFDSKQPEGLNFSNSTFVQVYNAMVNSARTYIYVDGKPVTGAALVPGSVFPSNGTGISTSFAVPSGLRAFLVRDTATITTQLPLSFAENMKAASYQTIFLYDTITSPKQKTVITNIEEPADSTIRLRVANFIYNPTIVPGIDVFSFVKNANIFTNVQVTDVTNFIPYPSKHAPDTLYIRETGTLVDIIKIPVTAGSITGTYPLFSPKRSYTLVYRGSHRGTRIASVFPNR